ncbi:MAG: DUF4330 domain-containing protein [Lawsonibacter sp.]|nr:DUF4330 domain-containing protein [Lawsonibacter sp.]
MKLLDQNGRLFGTISVIDLLVVAVVIVMAAALQFKSEQTLTGTSVQEEPITFEIEVYGVRRYVAEAIREEDQLYDMNYASGSRSLGEITRVQVTSDPGTVVTSLNDGTVAPIEAEDTVNLLLTVEGTGLVSGNSRTLNRVYDLGINASRNFYTRMVQFTGTISNIF